MKYPKPNLSKGEQKTMEELAKRKDIIITNADKGSAVVITDVEKYNNQANRQLFNKRNNKKIQRYNAVIWLTIQLTGFKKKIYFLKN